MPFTNGLYAPLDDGRKQLLVGIKELILGDRSATAPWFDSGDADKMDAYAAFMQMAVEDMDVDLNQVFPYNGWPPFWASTVREGTALNAIEARMSQFVELEEPKNMQDVPYFDARDFLDRWSRRAEILRAAYAKSKKNLRYKHLPGPAATVDSYGFYGVHQIPIQYAGCATWFWPFYRVKDLWSSNELPHTSTDLPRGRARTSRTISEELAVMDRMIL